MSRTEIIVASLLVFICRVDADDLSDFGPDCEVRLEAFVPEEVETKNIAMRANITMSKWPLIITEAMRREQLIEQYWATPELQASSVNPEEFIQSVWHFYEDDEASARISEPSRVKIQMHLSATNMYARYYDPLESGILTQEVVKMRTGFKSWPTWRINHAEQTITECVETDANDFYGYYLALAPQNGLSVSWVTLMPMLLRKENRAESFWQLLCQGGGEAMILDQTYRVQFAGIDKLIYTTFKKYGGDTKYSNITIVSESELERGAHVRLLRAELIAPSPELRSTGIHTIVNYGYKDASSLWPSERHTVERNMENDQIMREEHLEIREVAPASKWDMQAILTALLEKYSDYKLIKR